MIRVWAIAMHNNRYRAHRPCKLKTRGHPRPKHLKAVQGCSCACPQCSCCQTATVTEASAIVIMHTSTFYRPFKSPRKTTRRMDSTRAGGAPRRARSPIVRVEPALASRYCSPTPRSLASLIGTLFNKRRLPITCRSRALLLSYHERCCRSDLW